jgi:hypothetical protein
MSSLEKPVYDDRVLIQYLLGSLPEEDTGRFDELSVVDDEFCGRLSAVENDLVDAYARGELSGETAERFQSFYLSSARRREKVRFAETLLIHGDRAALVPARPSPWHWFSGPHVALQWSFAATAFVMLAASAYLFRENLALRDQLKQVRAERIALQRQQSAAPVPPSRELTVLSFVLSPQMRGGGEIATLALPRGTDRVSLRLTLELDDFSRYQAALKNPATNEIVWSSIKLKSENQSVLLSLPASLLKQQNYTLELMGIPAGGPSAFVGGYPFRVLIK